MTGFVCAIDGHGLERDPHASRLDHFEHYRCPECREGGVHDPETGRQVGPVFEGRTPHAAIAVQVSDDAGSGLLASSTIEPETEGAGR